MSCPEYSFRSKVPGTPASKQGVCSYLPFQNQADNPIKDHALERRYGGLTRFWQKSSCRFTVTEAVLTGEVTFPYGARS